MPFKFNLGINGVGQGAAEERQSWSGELPPTGTYDGVLKILSVGKISQNSEKYAGQDKMSVGIELRNTTGRRYDGYIAWGALNLIDPSIRFVNQFLHSLTDGSQAQIDAIENAFYEKCADLDTTKKHIQKIGRWVVNSPNGELPIKVSLVNKPYVNERVSPPVVVQSVRVESYLMGGGAGPNAVGSGNGSTQDIPEEEAVNLDLEPEDYEADESILDV